MLASLNDHPGGGGSGGRGLPSATIAGGSGGLGLPSRPVKGGSGGRGLPSVTNGPARFRSTPRLLGLYLPERTTPSMSTAASAHNPSVKAIFFMSDPLAGHSERKDGNSGCLAEIVLFSEQGRRWIH